MAKCKICDNEIQQDDKAIGTVTQCTCGFLGWSAKAGKGTSTLKPSGKAAKPSKKSAEKPEKPKKEKPKKEKPKKGQPIVAEAMPSDEDAPAALEPLAADGLSDALEDFPEDAAPAKRKRSVPNPFQALASLFKRKPKPSPDDEEDLLADLEDDVEAIASRMLALDEPEAGDPDAYAPSEPFSLDLPASGALKDLTDRSGIVMPWERASAASSEPSAGPLAFDMPFAPPALERSIPAAPLAPEPVEAAFDPEPPVEASAGLPLADDSASQDSELDAPVFELPARDAEPSEAPVAASQPLPFEVEALEPVAPEPVAQETPAEPETLDRPTEPELLASEEERPLLPWEMPVVAEPAAVAPETLAPVETPVSGEVTAEREEAEAIASAIPEAAAFPEPTLAEAQEEADRIAEDGEPSAPLPWEMPVAASPALIEDEEEQPVADAKPIALAWEVSASVPAAPVEEAEEQPVAEAKPLSLTWEIAAAVPPAEVDEPESESVEDTPVADLPWEAAAAVAVAEIEETEEEAVEEPFELDDLEDAVAAEPVASEPSEPEPHDPDESEASADEAADEPALLPFLVSEEESEEAPPEDLTEILATVRASDDEDGAPKERPMLRIIDSEPAEPEPFVASPEAEAAKFLANLNRRGTSKLQFVRDED